MASRGAATSSEEKLRETFSRFGGNLTFRYTSDEEGWMVECVEIPGMFTGAPNPNPTYAEIDEMVRDVIFSAFGISDDANVTVRRSANAQTAAPVLNIARPILKANEFIAVLGKESSVAHA